MSKRSLAFDLTLALGLAATASIAIAVGSREIVADRLQFQQRTNSLTTALQRNLNRYVDILHAIGDYYRTEEAQIVPDQFGIFVARALQENPGIQALEWAPYVTAEQRQSFEADGQAFWDNFQITERDGSGRLIAAGSRSSYVPVTYVEPLVGNEVAVGFDLASDPTRRQALEKADRQGMALASGRIVLVQESEDQYGFLVFLPVRDPDAGLQGYLLGVFRVGDVVAEAVKGLDPDIDFQVYDDSAEPAESYLGSYRGGQQALVVAAEDPALTWNQQYLCISTCVQRFELAGRQWRLQFYPPQTPWRLPIATLATVIVGGLVTAVVMAMQQRSQLRLAQAEELSALKQELFGMVSHELRTPLSTILMSAQSLEMARTLYPDQAAKIYHRIRVSAKHMTQLLDDLLTLNRAEAGKLDYEPELIPLAALCRRCIERVHSSSEQPRPITITTQGQGDPVWLDPKLVQAVVTNLLANAVKYSQLPVHLDLIYADDEVIITVRDQGIGIPIADQSRLFETFYRGNNVSGIPGTGLGLAIVQICTRIHRGTVHFSSVENQGSSFSVILPTLPPSDSQCHTPSQ